MVFYYLLETWVHKVEKRQKYCLYMYIFAYSEDIQWIPPPHVFPTTWSSVITNYGIAASCVPSLCLYVWPLCPLASTLTITEPPPSYKCGMKTTIKLPQHRPPLLCMRTPSHTKCANLFYYDELVHCSSHQYPITHFPTKYLALPMASLGARSKRSHN